MNVLKHTGSVLSTLAAVLLLLPGCKYEAAAPQYNTPLGPTTSPTVTRVEPASAVSGVNTVTIFGGPFSLPPDSNVVYFGSTIPEVVGVTVGSITVRRPNLVTDSCSVKVVSKNAILVAKYASPYSITKVVDAYGGFVANVNMIASAVDSAENLYVVDNASKKVIRVSPTGFRDTTGTMARFATDMRVGPDGGMYILSTNKYVSRVNLTTRVLTSNWKSFPRGEMRFGDFDAKGYFYAGGISTDLYIAGPGYDFPNAKASGVYGNDEILAVRVYANVLYVASRTSNFTPVKIWKHALDGTGTLGAQQLVVDLGAIGDSSTVTGVAVSSTGKLFISTNAAAAMLVFDPVANKLDYFYRYIIPSYGKTLSWGTGTYVYMITGDGSTTNNWLVSRVDMGTTSARP